MASGSSTPAPTVLCSDIAWGYVSLTPEEVTEGRNRIGIPEINLTAVWVFHLLKTRAPDLAAGLTLTHLRSATSILEQIERAVLQMGSAPEPPNPV